MRLVPLECIRENSILGKNIYTNDGQVLLRAGIRLTDILLKKIRDLKIFSLYIIDEYSASEIEDIIKPELRQKSISFIKEVFSDIERISCSYKFEKRKIDEYSKKEQDYFNRIGELAEELLNTVLNNRNILLYLVDIKSMDNYTYSHCVNVAIISIIIGISLKLNKSDLIDLCIGALIHDIGKTFIPQEILQKPGKLTPEEFEIIKSHPELGYDFLNNFLILRPQVKSIVIQHHERFDGYGYPYGISGNDINYLARIVSIADVYDALTSDRPYKKALSPSDALEYIMSNAGTSFDFDIVNVFSKVIITYPKGTIVSLSNGETAIVEKTLPSFPLRPVIKILKSNDTKKVGSKLNLVNNNSIVISDIIYEL